MPEDGQHRRELEQQAHQEDHGRENGDIGVQREGVDHRGADLIVVEKDQQHRHDDKIADGDPEIEQPAAKGEGLPEHGFFGLIQRRHDKTPDLVADQGESGDQRDEKGHLDVGEELGGDVDVDEVDADVDVQQAVEPEIGPGRAQDDTVEERALEEEPDDEKHKDIGHGAENGAPQLIYMVPEGHFAALGCHRLFFLVGILFLGGFLDLALDFVHALAEALDALAEAAHEFGNLLAAEQKEKCQDDQKDLPETDGAEKQRGDLHSLWS